MAEQIQCPHCGNFIVPVEKQVAVWDTRNIQDIARWIFAGVLSILLIAGGIVALVIYQFALYGILGIGVAILGIILSASIIRLYLQRARRTESRHVCPLCRKQWAGEVSSRDDLEIYYTNTEKVLNKFDTLIVAPTLPRRLLLMHGVGGIGKSSLLRIFRIHCRRQHIPVALASGEQAKSLGDILTEWAKDFSAQSIILPAFNQKLTEYRAIQSKVVDRAKSEQTAQNDVGKSVLKIAMQAAGGAAGMIPIVGLPISAVLGGAGDTIVDWLQNFLTKPQINLLLDPTEELLNSFLEDLTRIVEPSTRHQTAQRIVLILDTFEQITELSRWICSLAKQVHPNVLLVIAGRALPSWDAYWPGWRTQAATEELQPMSDEIVRALIHNYYAILREGTPDPAQVDAIIAFARGLPIAVTTVVQLWVDYGVEDFQAVKPRVVADLVDQLTRGVPERIRPVLKVAGSLRWFNQDLLRTISGDSALDDTIYEELRRFPFIRPRREGLALHDIVREHLDENLRLHEPQRHKELHEKAAQYFEQRASQTSNGDEAAEMALEGLYQRTMIDEDEGTRQFRKIAEELVRYQLLRSLRTLLNDVNNYLHKEPNRLWLEYYRARLRDLEGQAIEAEAFYKAIADNTLAEDILRAYALCDLAWSVSKVNTQHMEELLEIIHQLFPEPDTLPEPDAKLGSYLLAVSSLRREQGRWEDAFSYLQRAQRLFGRLNDLYWLALTDNQIRYYYMDQGIWGEALKMQKKSLQEITKLVGEKQQSYLEAEILGGVAIGWMLAGRYAETEEKVRKALRIAERFERVQQQVYFQRDLAYVLGLQGKIQEATERFAESIKLGQQYDPLFEAITYGFEAIVALKWTGVAEADHYFNLNIEGLRRQTGKRWAELSFLNYYGVLEEVKGNAEAAVQIYRECLDLGRREHWYWHTGALTGLIRALYAKGDYSAIPSLLEEADSLAQKYEYNDFLASLRLIQGHFAWDDEAVAQQQRVEVVLSYYQQALIYALRYNRFLLDQVLSGLPHGTPWQPIVPYCLQRGKEGQDILLRLQNHWQNAINDVGISYPDSISLIPEGILLLEGERQARQLEPGNKTSQKTVVEQLAQFVH